MQDIAIHTIVHEHFSVCSCQYVPCMVYDIGV